MKYLLKMVKFESMLGLSILALILISVFPNPLHSRGLAPERDVCREQVDLIELNHFYDEQGRLVFDQDIFYNWTDGADRYDVKAWRLVKNTNQIPQRDFENGGYSCFWNDGEQTRHIYAKAFKETWTQYDPELIEREYLPKEKRKEFKTVQLDKPKGATRPK